MNMKAQVWWAVGAAVGMTSSAFAQTVIYDNSTTALGSYFSATGEFGDDIYSSGGLATGFHFEIFKDGVAPGATATVRFYANDGAAVVGGGGSFASPGTLLWTSSAIDLLNGGDTGVQAISIDLNGLGVNVPAAMTWTIEGTGLGSGTLGLSLYNPPTTGSSFDDAWSNVGGTWTLVEGTEPLNFGATLVPEPGALTLLGLGALALFLRRRN